ncbi:hypothetical protein GCM10010840_29310 [Deinococcus aerolatus]|uniref:N-acetyltransferase domain-containing protein n=2 Tax=Deinococcus aerolatus TaxID=522487 RepID=A0ABQ2GEI8_9DEIO|nr:hypothetical protein GCM10010840_29310 [Deinococcus aerolatus]
MDELLRLYSSVGWTAYAGDPEALARAVQQSSFVWTARDENGELIGLVRGLTDDISILWVQTLLINPRWQRMAWAAHR